MDPHTASTIAVVSFFGVVGWTAWLVARRFQAGAAAQAELRRQMVDKFAGADEFARFAATPEGQRLLHAKTPASDEAARYVLWAVRVGTALGVIGAGVFLLGFVMYRTGEDDAYPLAVFGALFGIVGFGFLASAFVSHRLARALRRASADATPPYAAPAGAGLP